jgi:hypothetical protein
MKKTLVYLAFIFGGSVIFSSCRSGITIQKRHYGRGYYVAWHKSGTAGEKPAENKTVHTVNTITDADHSMAVKKEAHGIYSGSVQTAPPPKVYTAVEKQSVTKTASRDDIRKYFLSDTKKLEEPGYKYIKALDVMPKAQFQSSRDDETLSLLWIVIVVLIILWALGFLVGGLVQGGFIHLLLVVALILLILWLLRII